MTSKTEITVHGKTIELQNSLPLTLGDWEKLSKAGIMVGAQVKMSINEPGGMIDFIWILARKQDKDTTREEIEAIPLEEIPHVHEVVNKMTEEDKKTASDPSQ